MPDEGLEPSRPCGQSILSAPRLPFRQSGAPRASYARAARASAPGNPRSVGASGAGPMLDSPASAIAVRRAPPPVEDLRSTTVPDDPVQRRDLILLERAREGTSMRSTTWSLPTRTCSSRSSCAWSRTATPRPMPSRKRSSALPQHGRVPWRQRQVVAQPDRVNAAMDAQRPKKRRPVQPYPELEDETWQPPAGR